MKERKNDKGEVMSSKWRSNYKIGLCTRFDCMARDIRCHLCFMKGGLPTEYMPKDAA